MANALTRHLVVQSVASYPTLWQICVEIVSYIIMKMNRAAILLKHVNHHCLHSFVSSSSDGALYEEKWCVHLHLRNFAEDIHLNKTSRVSGSIGIRIIMMRCIVCL